MCIQLHIEDLEQRLMLSGLFSFASDFGGGEGDLIVSSGVAADQDGNSYSTGQFLGTIDFDPGPGKAELTSNNVDTYVTKLDPLGNLLWTTQFSGPERIFSYGITVDNQGNVLVAGAFEGHVDFDPGLGEIILEEQNNTAGFVAKLDSDGNLIWAARTGTGGFNFALGVAADPQGNIFAVGSFVDTVDFDPSELELSRTSNGGSPDIFISKLDSDGNFLDAWTTGGTSSEYPRGVDTDGAGNLIVTGSFWGTADFDPSAETHELTSAGMDDAFLAKYSNDGQLIWAHGFGANHQDFGYGVAAGPDDSIHFTGTFGRTIDFDPSESVAEISSERANNDMFVAKYSADGEYLWANSPRLIGANDAVRSSGIAVDSVGNVYTAGSFRQDVDFDPGPGEAIPIGSYGGGRDAYIQKLDAQGQFVWVRAFGGISSEDIYGIALSSTGILTTGAFSNTADFDPGEGVYELTADDGAAFLSQLAKDFIVPGTSGDDLFEVTIELDKIIVKVDGKSYSAALIDGQVIPILIDGKNGNDSIIVTGNSTDEEAVVSPVKLIMTGDRYRLKVIHVEEIQVHSGSPSGNDLITFIDSSGNDQFTGHDGYGRMIGSGFMHEAFDFGIVVARSFKGGDDIATLLDTDGNDLFVGYDTFSRFMTVNAVTKVYGFGEVIAQATNGLDTARFYDSIGNEQFFVSPGDGRMVGDFFLNRAYDFDRMIGYSNRGGTDLAYIDDSVGNDVLRSSQYSSRLTGSGYLAQAIRFEQVTVNGSSGLNRAYFYDSVGTDIYRATQEFSQMSGDGFLNRANSFNYTYAYSTKGGADEAFLDDSAGNDLLVARHNVSFVRGDDFRRQASGFGAVTMNASTGNDIGRMYDWTGDDTFIGDGNSANLFGDGFNNHIFNLDKLYAYSINGGEDELTSDNINYTLVPLGNWS